MLFFQLHAEYNRDSDEYAAHRVLQAYDTAQLVKMTSGNADIVILGGDLNTEPGDLSYQVLLHSAELEDAFSSAPVSTQHLRLITAHVTLR